jgi:hypothetical protein
MPLHPIARHRRMGGYARPRDLGMQARLARDSHLPPTVSETIDPVVRRSRLPHARKRTPYPIGARQVWEHRVALGPATAGSPGSGLRGNPIRRPGFGMRGIVIAEPIDADVALRAARPREDRLDPLSGPTASNPSAPLSKRATWTAAVSARPESRIIVASEAEE